MNVHLVPLAEYLYLRTDIFPIMKHTKNRRRILDELRLENTLRITSIKPRYR